MYLIVNETKFRYEMENLCRIFYPLDNIITLEALTDGHDGRYALVLLERSGDSFIIKISLVYDGASSYKSRDNISIDTSVNELELIAANCFYEALCEVSGKKPAWGMLTGVRPSKLMRTLIDEKGEALAKKYFTEVLHVSEEKTSLAAEIVSRQRKTIELSKKNSFSLYVSIPFCPTRCSYCSFVSHSITSAKKLIAPYVELLCKEIEQTAAIAKTLGLKLETIYFGGGTPTVLDASMLDMLTAAVNSSFLLSSVREYTVEAGRPDTLTIEKLEVLKKAGVTRVSVNPQSFDDEILKNIGRRHTAEEAVEAFLTARAIGFDCINMDFIAGLPGDSREGFRKSIEKAILLSPENISVHTLAMKKAAELVTEKKQQSASAGTAGMLEDADKILREAAYHPYYMYRQSKTVGNLENTGWAKGGLLKNNNDCFYNIYMMEEIHTVLAVGAGAVTKLKSPDSSYIERIFNFKYPYEYIDRFMDVEKRKERVELFYGEHK